MEFDFRQDHHFVCVMEKNSKIWMEMIDDESQD